MYILSTRRGLSRSDIYQDLISAKKQISDYITNSPVPELLLHLNRRLQFTLQYSSCFATDLIPLLLTTISNVSEVKIQYQGSPIQVRAASARGVYSGVRSTTQSRPQYASEQERN